MPESTNKNVVIGYLANLSFDGGAEKLGKEHYMESGFVRGCMCDTLEGRLKKSEVHYCGPICSPRYPPGGYFFKMQKEQKNLKESVLKKLIVDDSLKIPIEVFPDSPTISLGIVVKEYPKDKYHNEISFCEDNVLDLAKNMAAFYRHMGERLGEEYIAPHFIVVDANFQKEFPVDQDLDST